MKHPHGNPSLSFEPNRILRTLALAVLVMTTAMSARAADTLVSLGAAWRYLDDGSNQGTAWRAGSFDDSDWPSGPAQLGYGDGDEATVVSFGPNSSSKYITTYFRRAFSVPDPGAYVALNLRVMNDDGVVVYLNGQEVYRNNMPGGSVSFTTTASSAYGGADESALREAVADAALLVSGANQLAVEIHQANATSSDISFDMELQGLDSLPAESPTRGPYLQQGTPNSIIIRWRTAAPSDSIVLYGTDPQNLTGQATGPANTTEHEVLINGLTSDTDYFYEVSVATGSHASPDYFFHTSPPVGPAHPTRIWVLGDSGTANANAAAVRDAYLAVMGGTTADFWLMLGDNAYNNGTDSEYQAGVFNMYPSILANTVLWPTEGNHDNDPAYYNIFTLPVSGQAGGVASGTEEYYSFDYANIHVICLNSMDGDLSANGAMGTWLQSDLAATTAQWLIAFWHHPPYSKGSHNSDTESRLVQMRQNFLPILEAAGVDLVLCGHSHSYERSHLLDGHYGDSGTLNPSTMILDNGGGREDGNGAYEKPTDGLGGHEGAVYVTAGSSGKTSGGSLNHPAMFVSLNELGSLLIDVDGNRMDVQFLRELDGSPSQPQVDDYFTLIKGSISVPGAPTGLAATAGDAQVNLTWNSTSGATTYHVKRRTSGGSFTTIASPASPGYLDTDVSNGTTYFYVVSAENAVGEGPNSAEVSATPDSLVNALATADLPSAGTVNGSYVATHSSDDLRESITERESGGRPQNRYSYLDHTWTFSVTPGTTVTLFIEAHRTANAEGDDFVFSYSQNNQDFTDALTVTKPADDDTPQIAVLPATLSGTVYLRVRDTDQTQGQNSLDTVFIDHLLIQTDTGTISTPPQAPGNLVATGQDGSVALAWDPAPTATSYNVKRGASASGPFTTIGSPTDPSFLDGNVSNGTTYYYVVSAINAVGEGPGSAVASATPDAPSAPEPPTNLVATPGKKKKIELSWTQPNPAASVLQNRILRSQSASGPFTEVALVNATTSYSDPGLSSGTTYYYQVTALTAGGESAPSGTASATAP